MKSQDRNTPPLKKRKMTFALSTLFHMIRRLFHTLRKANDLHTANYYFEKGFRKVLPYDYQFHMYAKKRMRGHTILDVFMKEYRGRSEQYYRRALEEGWITVNQQKVTASTLLQHHDFISHRVHRHEPPVLDIPIDIVYEDGSLLVINKPPTVPVHPGGRYRHNTVVHILRKELGYERLYPAHRLDTLTSGIMLIAKTSDRSDRIERMIRSGDIKKEYVCKVIGEFPIHSVCDQPIQSYGHTVSFNYVCPEGKPSLTVFDRLSYDGIYSVVRCRPVTGRTHQIRVHLRHLGFPIANDPIYGHNTPWTHLLHDIPSLIQSQIDHAPYDYMDDDPDTSVPRCHVCQVPIPPHDPSLQPLYLHAHQYASSQWTYQTPLPLWAQ
ncbi:pseudouridine synthase [Pilobolus umbonatus]|nr:pseudouridine synthase [Pilobolus umbonatus]